MGLATGAIALPVGAPAVEAAAAPTARNRARRLMGAAAGASVLVALVLCGLRLTGVEWFVVSTPSMGTAVPVGTLVVDAPVRLRSLEVGDVITFTPPGAVGSVHTHRVVEVVPQGVRTRGDANGEADPWTLSEDLIRGRVVAALPGAGWLVRALPLLLLGGLVTWGVALLLRRRDHRIAAVVLGASLSLSAVSVLLRPLVNAVLLTATAGTRGSVATVVSTGLLPIRISASSGAHVDLVAGQVGVLRSGGPAGRIDLTVAPHLPPLGWAVVVLVCAVPLLVPFALSGPERRR